MGTKTVNALAVAFRPAEMSSNWRRMLAKILVSGLVVMSSKMV